MVPLDFISGRALPASSWHTLCYFHLTTVVYSDFLFPVEWCCPDSGRGSPCGGGAINWGGSGLRPSAISLRSPLGDGYEMVRQEALL